MCEKHVPRKYNIKTYSGTNCSLARGQNILKRFVSVIAFSFQAATLGYDNNNACTNAFIEIKFTASAYSRGAETLNAFVFETCQLLRWRVINKSCYGNIGNVVTRRAYKCNNSGDADTADDDGAPEATG